MLLPQLPFSGDVRRHWFDHFQSNLYEGRWNFVHDFIVEAEPLLKVLSEMWSEVQFSQGGLCDV